MKRSTETTTTATAAAAPEACPMPKRARKDKNDKRLGVTVLSGFLGSGKTTLLKHLLKLNDEKEGGYKFALIVNDMNELNIDANLIKRTQTSLQQADAKLVEMQNGCICCTLREDLLVEIKKIAAMDPCPFDYMIIESTGIGEPLPVAETFTFGVLKDNSLGAEAFKNANMKEMRVLSDVARLDTLVTVVDASTFREHFVDSRQIHEGLPPQNIDKEDDRTVVNLLVEQVEFANVILLNKCDLVDKETLDYVRAAIKSMNIGAKVIETKHSQVDLKEIINTNTFTFEMAADNPLWLKEMRGQHVPETEEYGISTFIYRARRPFHPKKLQKLLAGPKLKDLGLLRSKGLTWIASYHDACIEWSGTSNCVDLSIMQPWFVDMKEEEWKKGDEEDEKIMEALKGEYGDRRQMLVLIGFDAAGARRPELESALNDCLLTEEEYKAGPKTWDIESDIIVFENVHDDGQDPFGDGEEEEEEEEAKDEKPKAQKEEAK